MQTKKIGKQSIVFSSPPSILHYANAVGKKEGDGPLSSYFDYISPDDTFGESSWEKSETAMQEKALTTTLQRSRLSAKEIDYIFAGDLLNQCIASAYNLRNMPIPFFGLYGACSTMAESLLLSAMSIDGLFADNCIAMTSSHFCSAERQYRTPLEYGNQRTPTSQWTATGSGCILLSKNGKGPYITHATVGKIEDKGITDVNNMGAAMAPAAYSTIKTHLTDFKLTPDDFDLIVTGDLGVLGKEIVTDLFKRDGISISSTYDDCGAMLYDMQAQDAHAGASGCGCSAIVLTGYLLKQMKEKKLKRILFCGTGALHSPTSIMQGESIPGICHAVTISNTKEA